jgi:hypothetical protein
MRFEIVSDGPLVVTGVVEHADDATALAAELGEAFPGRVFIGIITAEEGDDVAGIVRALAPLTAELIFTASSSLAAIPGDTLAWTALTEVGVGQDFVFTVPTLPGAIRYATKVLLGTDGNRWEGTALLVPGRADVLLEAQAGLGPDPIA